MFTCDGLKINYEESYKDSEEYGKDITTSIVDKDSVMRKKN